MKKYFLLIVFGVSMVFAQTKTYKNAADIHFLSSELIADVNIDQEAFLDYFVKVIDTCRTAFESSTETGDVLIVMTLHKNEDPTYQIAGKPAIEESKKNKILNAIKKVSAIRSKLVDYSLLCHIKLNGGSGKKMEDFYNIIDTPDEIAYEDLRRVPLHQKVKLIKDWARNEVLPILGAMEKSVDPAFKGVIAVGNLVAGLDFNRENDMVTLTEKNPNYWRAILEMSLRNNLIVTTKIMMHVANGEFDYARNYLPICEALSDPKSLGAYYNNELFGRFDVFYKALQTEIEAGIKLHDEGNYADAIKAYQTILEAYPNSAWTQYELFYSTFHLHEKEGTIKTGDYTDWTNAKDGIYKASPMYDMDFHAGSGKEGYLLQRRKEQLELFKNKNDFNKNLISYADIALDLGVYGFAAQIYWWSIQFVPESEYKPRKIIFHFLYCLDKLGDNETKLNFKGDYQKEFDKITKEREKLMKASTFYKVFKN